MRFPLTVVLVVMYCGSVAQFQKFSHELFFNRYTTDDGLSHASCNTILRDSKGFVWFGTDDGLNRYDGHQFKVYKRKPDDSTSLIGNTVNVLWEDSLSRLWIGTSEGLSVYDRHLEKFRSYFLGTETFYPCIDLAPDPRRDRIWIAGGTLGLMYFDGKKDQPFVLSNAATSALNVLQVELVGDQLFIGTLTQGLYVLDLHTSRCEPVVIAEKKSVNPAIRAIAFEDGNLWIGTEGGGLKKLDVEKRNIMSFTKESGHISDNKVWSLAADSEKLWIGTDGGGLTVLNKATLKSNFFKHSYYNARSISSNTVRSVSIDPTGDLWFGTFNGGVSYLPSFAIKFHTFRKEPDTPFSLPHNAILCFYEQTDGTLLIGTDGGGLAYMKDGKFFKYNFPDGVKPPSVVLSIKETSEGDIFLGTYQEGLYKIGRNKAVKRFQFSPDDVSSISSNIVWDIEEDDDGMVWLATEVGLNRLYPWDTKFTNYRNAAPEEPKNIFTSEFSQTLLLDSAKTLWVGFFGELRSVYVPTGKVTRYIAGTNPKLHVPNKQILCLTLDAKDRNVIWFSSFGAGLIRLNTITRALTYFTEENGLPNNLISAIQTDRKGNVWLTCNKGLVRFNPAEKSFYVFEKSFGINIAPFKDNASAISSSGYVLFGGTNGFAAFWPGDVNFQKRSLDVVFTGFTLFNEDVPIDNTLLQKSITETTALRIPYDQTRLMSFEFSVPNFLAPSMVQYQYSLEGFEDQWHVLNQANISFTNLLPGDYTLKVKAGFPSGIWGEEKKLGIHVIPPWWMAWYSRVGLLVLVAGFAYSFFAYRTYSLNKRKVELESIVAKQNQEIRNKNRELADQNEKLSSHNLELLESRETIGSQNKMLSQAQEQLKEINQSLEQLVHQRTEKLNDTIHQLNKTIRELDAFLYSASHDLVSPLKSILGLVNLAKRENIDPNIEYYFDHIEISVKKLEAIIHMLMQHSFNTKAELKYELVDLKTIIDETLLEVKFLPDADKISFQCDFQQVRVKTDIHRLKIILSNLFSNAVKYHDSSKPSNVVDLRYSNGGSNWTLEIHDNGIGIEKARIPKVFDLFYRATESAKGSGLGLYIVKDTMERLGGRIDVDSEIGRWTKFTISMPVEPS
jgi:signal transduction histidine kinase/ligand-binding sensor domain-containing protein